MIELYQNEITALKEQRKKLDKHIQISELPESEKYSSLTTEKKHIMDTIKMIAYRAETALATIIQPEQLKRKETWALLRQIFSTEIDPAAGRELYTTPSMFSPALLLLPL
ncbi:MAG: putative transposase [Candidatus Omnitrophota bacterium]